MADEPQQGSSARDARGHTPDAPGAETDGPPLDARAKFGGGVLTILWGTLPAILGTTLLIQVGQVAPWLKSHGEWGLVVYVVLFAVLSGVGVLPTYAQAIVGGWAFGMVRGGIGGIVGFAGGATLGFVITRLIAGDGFRAWLDARPKARVIRLAFVESGFWRSFGTVALIRVNSPFSLTNLAMSASGVHYIPYVLGTAVGLAPRTLVAASIGAAAASQGAPNFQELAKRSPWTLVVLIATFIVVAAILTLAGKAALRKAGLDGSRPQAR